MSPRAERRALQALILAAGLVPVGAGLAGILVGPAAFGGDGEAGYGATNLASHLAYLSGLLLAIGLGFWACVPTIERRGAAIRVMAGIVFTGGLARLSSIGIAGVPDLPHLLALVMELGVTPAVALWQRRVARRTAA